MRYFQILFLSIITIALIACNNEATDKAEDITNDNETLSTDLVNNPHSATESNLSNAGQLVFVDTVHDFGNLKEGEMVTYDFEYTNTGKKEILITSAKGSCGCTVPEWDSSPIAPGAKGTMKVTFDSKDKLGYNEKSVLITTSGVPAQYKLFILAKVD